MENKSLIINTSTTEQSTINSKAEKAWLKIIICVAYSFIFILGVLGNATVCFILYYKQKLKTVTNLFIFNLAISDLIFAGSIPLEFPLIIGDYKWPYTPFFCKLYTPVQTIAVSVSIFSLTAVSVIRYRAIVHPLKKQVSYSYAKYILFGIWTVSTLLMIPHIATLKIKGSICDEEWPNITYRKIYTTLLSVCFYVVPLTIVSFAYTKIVAELKKKQDYDNTLLNDVRNEETRRVVNLLVIITIVFAFCNLPCQVMWLWLDFGNADKTFSNFFDILAAMNVFIFANSACNPLLYYIFHHEFRQEVSLYLKKNCKKRTSARSFIGNDRLLTATGKEIVMRHALYNASNSMQACKTRV